MARLDPSAPPSASDSVQRAVKEFRRLPEDDERMIRWGFIGAFGKDGVDGAEHWACSIHTMKQEEYFNGPNASDENIAVFADAFTNPHTIRICKHLFFRQGNEKTTREEIKRECDLTNKELDAALEAFLEWRFVAWAGEELLILGHGMNWVITLIGMTKEAINQRDGSSEQE